MANKITKSNNPVLDEIVRGYSIPGFIRQDVLPSIRVPALKGDIPTKNGDHLRIVNNLFGGKAGTPEVDYQISKADGWSIQTYGLKNCVTKEDAQNWNPANPSLGMQQMKQQITTQIRNMQLLQSEFALAGTVFDDTNYDASNTKTLSGTAQYNGSTSNPYGDFQDAAQAVWDDTGLLVNTAIMGWEVFNVLRNNSDIIARVSNDSNRLQGLSVEQLAMAMGVDKVLVGLAKYNTAAKGQTKALASVWGKHILMTHVNPNPSATVFEESFGYRFVNEEIVTDTYKIADPKDAEFVRVTEKFDDLILNFDAGYFIKDAVA